jgi:hypothetical protein
MNYLRGNNGLNITYDEFNYTELNYTNYTVTEYNREFYTWLDWVASWFWQ